MAFDYVFVQLATRKEGLTLAQFKKHHEEIWVPLVKEICAHAFPLTWTRRYLAQGEHEAQRKAGAAGLPIFLVGLQEDVGWDCLAEMTFTDELHFQQFFARINEEEAGARLREEEEKFSDSSKLKFIVMDATTDINVDRMNKLREREKAA